MGRALRVLELSGRPTEAEVHRAYRRLAKLLHPDVSTLPDAVERFKELQRAYDKVLLDLKVEVKVRRTQFGLEREGALKRGGIWFGR